MLTASHVATCNLACTDLLMNTDRMPKPGQSDLLHGSQSPAEKVGVNRHFQASRVSQPMGCLLHYLTLYNNMQ